MKHSSPKEGINGAQEGTQESKRCKGGSGDCSVRVGKIAAQDMIELVGREPYEDEGRERDHEVKIRSLCWNAVSIRLSHRPDVGWAVAYERRNGPREPP